MFVNAFCFVLCVVCLCFLLFCFFCVFKSAIQRFCNIPLNNLEYVVEFFFFFFLFELRLKTVLTVRYISQQKHFHGLCS